MRSEASVFWVSGCEAENAAIRVKKYGKASNEKSNAKALAKRGTIRTSCVTQPIRSGIRKLQRAKYFLGKKTKLEKKCGERQPRFFLTVRKIQFRKRILLFFLFRYTQKAFTIKNNVGVWHDWLWLSNSPQFAFFLFSAILLPCYSSSSHTLTLNFLRK